MSEPTHHHITFRHYAAFGMIVNFVAEIDTLFDAAIINILGGKKAAHPLLTLLGSKDKRDYLFAMARESTWPVTAIEQFGRLLDRAKSASDLRNLVAHWGWCEGQSPGKINPMTLSARGVLRIRGLEHQEKQWSSDELLAEAQKIRELGRDLVVFMHAHGLLPDNESRSSTV